MLFLHTEGPSELDLRAGDVVTMVEKVDSEWYRGTCKGSAGFFPINYVKVLVSFNQWNPLLQSMDHLDDDKAWCVYFGWSLFIKEYHYTFLQSVKLTKTSPWAESKATTCNSQVLFLH